MFVRRLVSAFLTFSVSALLLSFALPTAEAAALDDGYADCMKKKMQWCVTKCIDPNDLCLIEPIDPDKPVIDGDDPNNFLDVFKEYVNDQVWQWVFAAGVAIALLNGTIGGLQIVLSNGDSGKIDAGKTRFISSAIGLIILLLTGVILEFINPIGFQNG